MRSISHRFLPLCGVLLLTGARTPLLLGLVLTLVLGSTRWLRLNLSPSVPYGLYRLTAVPAEVRRGALVVLPVPTSVRHIWPAWIPLVKPVAGAPGDVVCHQDGRLQVNTVDYGPVYRDAHGRPLPRLEAGCQTVPAGFVFVASRADKSMDARYFGSLPIATLTAQAWPVLIWR